MIGYNHIDFKLYNHRIDNSKNIKPNTEEGDVVLWLKLDK